MRSAGRPSRRSRATSSTASTLLWTALKDAGLSPSDIADVVVISGSTRIPKEAGDRRGLPPPNWIVRSTRTRSSPSRAAIQGGVLQGDVKDVLLLDVLLSL